MPKIMGSTLADHRGQVRERLFAALDELMARRGYDSISLADIAADAGVGRTAVYNHFPDKESVLMAMAQEQTEAFVAKLQAALDEKIAPLDKLATFVRMQMGELAGHHVRMAGIGTALTAEGRVAMREHVTPLVTTLKDILRHAIEAGDIPQQDVSAAAAMISALTAGRFTLGLEGDELESALQSVMGFVLHGLGAVGAVTDVRAQGS